MIKNFLFVLNRFKTSSILNIMGLSVAFAVSSITMIQCYYDFSYNRNFKNAKEIYQFSYLWETFESRTAGISIPLAHAITDQFPEVQACCILNAGNDRLFKSPTDPATLLSFRLINTDEAFLDVFTPKILAGDAKTAFTEKNKVMLTADVARILFGEENPVGQMIWRDTIPYTVTAICEPFPANCSLKNGIYTTILGASDYDKIGYANYAGYFLLNPKDVASLQQKLEQTKFDKDTELTSMEFIPITEKYFRQDIDFHGETPVNLATTLSFMAIGIITLLIAFINFMNFSVAMIPSRVRGMNIQKIMGAGHRRLRFIAASEAPCFALFAFLIGLFLIALFQNTRLDEFFPADLSLDKNAGILVCIALSGIALAVLFGIYPAQKVTSFQPAMALSGSFAQSKQSVILRNILVTLQFLAAIVLICTAIFIKIQYDYMTGYSWGFQKENVVYLPVRSGKITAAYENEIRQNPSVLDCTSSEELPGSIKQNWGIDLDDQEVAFTAWCVRNDFLRFFDIAVIEGRDFIPDDDGKYRAICNQAFLKKYKEDKIVGKKTSEDFLEMVGVIKDIHFESLRSEIRPLCFVTGNIGNTYRYGNWLLIRISDDNTSQTINYLKTTWKKLSDEPLDLHFLDAQLDSLYQSENNLAKLISIFGIIAVIIAVMGVYGLIVFNAKYKAKEIAIRKVNGSTVGEIMLMLNRNMIFQFCIAFVVAVPVVYYITAKWLENFAYKINIYWWVFLLGGFIVLIITLLTVSVRSYQSAIANPTKALNKE